MAPASEAPPERGAGTMTPAGAADGSEPAGDATGLRREGTTRAPSRDTSSSSFGNISLSVTFTSGPNSVDRAGRGRPVWTATTSRSTPVSCSDISCAEANLRAGSGSVARTSRR